MMVLRVVTVSAAATAINGSRREGGDENHRSLFYLESSGKVSKARMTGRTAVTGQVQG